MQARICSFLHKEAFLTRQTLSFVTTAWRLIAIANQNPKYTLVPHKL